MFGRDIVQKSGAVLNTKIFSAFKGVYQKAKEKTLSTGSEVGGMPNYIKIIVFLILVGVVALYGWYFDLRSRLETPDNIRAHADSYLKKADEAGSISKNLDSRKSLLSYLRELEKQNVPASHFAFANFYVSTVNASGLFYPRIDGVVSPDAARLAVQAGARAFVFDIWPDLRSGANFGPILQVVEQSSTWRRISLNVLPFHLILNTIVGMIYSGGSGFLNTPYGSRDCLTFYLRFRGTPRFQTYAGVAAALRDSMEQYRLDSSFYACNGERRLFATPITQLFSKIIIMSNNTAQGTPLEDYINFLQRGPLPDMRDWDSKSIASLTDAMKLERVGILKQSLTFASPLPETDEAELNSWDWKKAHDLGIQYAGMNLFYASSTLNDYMNPTMFGVYSYKIKPANLRYLLLQQAAVGQAPNPGYGDGTPTQQTVSV